ncbi:type VI protein secretion system component VasF [Arthrobacter sp. UYNi723]
MKNMGISGSLLLLALLAGLWARTSETVSGRRYAATDPGMPAQDHPERGDVPGWVMITLMSAVLVAALLALAGPALETMFNQAMDKVGK